MRAALFGLDAACTGGSARVRLRLGFAYADAVGAARDYAQAARLDERACDGGLGEACVQPTRLVFQLSHEPAFSP